MIDLNILKDINGFRDWTIIEHIKKGWSEDIKYFVLDKYGNKYLLRLSPQLLYDKKKIEYENLEKLKEFGLNIPMPIEFGICINGMVYMLLSWIDGEDAIDNIQSLTKTRQYRLGIQAGKLLKTLHYLKPNSTNELWEDKYEGKIKNSIRLYKECGYSIEGEEDIINYIRENQSYLKDRPITFQHGDFHLGNMIITPDNKLAVIDFNRSSFGDPWEEYDRFAFSWSSSIEFAKGQIHGYFENKVPDEFFRLMCLYNARNSLASIPWSIPFGQKDINEALSNAAKTYESYNGYINHIPNWYEEPNKTP